MMSTRTQNVMISSVTKCPSHFTAIRTVMGLKHSVMVVTSADDVTAALQRFEDQLQSCFAHVEAVPLPDRGQDVQDVATLLCVYGHRRKEKKKLSAPEYSNVTTQAKVM